nr:DUF5916 domain-containing protein [Candidatus Krumholzibacteria bacterium]
MSLSVSGNRRLMVLSPVFQTLLLTISLSAALSLAAPPFEPNIQPTVSTSVAVGKIHIDGHLDELAWQQAGRARQFAERYPDDGTQPPVETEALITYDQDHLFVAFICHDDPELIRATLCQRDQFFNDDAVGLLLDTFGEGQWAYELFVNPYGIQKDLMWTYVQGEDRGFDMIWHSAAQITDIGYTVEMAIPFASMRFPAGDVQSWRLDFQREHPRQSAREYAWSGYDRNDQCYPCQWGRVEGITGVQAGKGLEILPSLIGYQTGRIRDSLDADSGLENEDIEGRASVGMKYSLTSDVTVEGTYNPDFSQIEADADQIDVNTTILQRYPERRPFFQEGNDLFRTYFNSFYTRMVVDPLVATKGTARWTKTSVAYMYARDEASPYIVPTEERSYTRSLGNSDVHVLRALHSLGNNSQAGVMATGRNYEDGGQGTILSADANFRLTSTLSWLGQFVFSDTEEPEGVDIRSGETFAEGRHTVDLDGETYTGNAFITELRRSAEHWNFTLDYNQVDPTYRTQTGYDPWNDQRNAFIWSNYHFTFDEGLVQRITPGLWVNGRWNYNGDRKWQHVNPSVNVQLRWAQTNFGIGYTSGSETWSGVAFDNLWRWNGYWNSRPSDRFGYYLEMAVAENPALFSIARGDEKRVSLALDIKPVDNLIIEPNLDFIQSKDNSTGELLFEQTIARMRLRWQLNKELSLRLVVQHNSSENPPFRDEAVAGNFPDYHMFFGGKWEVDPLLTYRVNSFSVFYLGSTHDYRDFNAAATGTSNLYRQTARQYFMKVQYLFQI